MTIAFKKMETHKNDKSLDKTDSAHHSNPVFPLSSNVSTKY